MSWKIFFFNHFIQNVSLLEKKILIDNTSLCSASSFIEFIEQKNIKCAVVDSAIKLMNAVNTDVNLIIVDQSNYKFFIPGVIKQSCQLIFVNYNNLPFNIDFSLYGNLSQEDLLNILDYASTFPTKLITTQNVKSVLKKSIRTRLSWENEKLNYLFNEFIKYPESVTYNAVLDIGINWGKYISNCYKMALNPDLSVLHQIDSVVLNFILNSGLKNLPYETVSEFKSVERIKGYLKYIGYEKKALICFDGMGWAEWFLLKRYLKENLKLNFKERSVFSMIPSTTKVSRYAIFAGNANEIYQTKYPNERKGLKKSFHNAELFKNSYKITQDSILGYKTISKIYNLFDETAHSTIISSDDFTKNTYFTIIDQYIKHTAIIKEIKILLDNGVNIFICSDHGCTLAKGNGQKIEKYLIDSYSKRGTIIKKNSSLQSRNYIRYRVPVPETPSVILARPGEMYDYQSSCELTHGGTSVEEMVIPFIEVKKVQKD